MAKKLNILKEDATIVNVAGGATLEILDAFCLPRKKKHIVVSTEQTREWERRPRPRVSVVYFRNIASTSLGHRLQLIDCDVLELLEYFEDYPDDKFEIWNLGDIKAAEESNSLNPHKKEKKKKPKKKKRRSRVRHDDDDDEEDEW
jgi:hypothetical protein